MSRSELSNSPVSASSTRRAGARLGTLCGLLAVGLSLWASAASASLTHFLQPCPGCFEQPRFAAGLGVDQASHLVYDASQGAQAVLKYDTSGNPQSFSALSSSELIIPNSAVAHLALDSSGDIYVVDQNASAVRKYLPSGEPDPLTPEIGAGTLSGVGGVGVDSSGDVYATRVSREAGEFKQGEVDEFSSGGTLLNSFGTAVFKPRIHKEGPPQDSLNDLAIDSAGNLYVATENGTFGFTESGSCLDACNPIDSGNGVAVAVEPGTDHLYVLDVENSKSRSHVSEFDSAVHANVELGAFGGEVLSNEVHTIAVDGTSGDIYASDVLSDQIDVFGPAVVIPTVRVAPRSDLQPTSVTLNGTVNTAGSQPADALNDCQFAYVSEEAFEATGFSDLSSGGEAGCEPPAASIPDDGADHPVSAAITGLAPATAYRFRLIAANANGRNEAEGEFTSAGPPRLANQSESADGLSATAATLHALVNPDQLSTTYHFEYGPTAAYGQSSAESAPIGSDLAFHPVSSPLTSLQPETTYHFRVVATNSAGAVEGPDRTFTTLPPVLIDAQPPTALGAETATLRAFLNPQGAATTYHFEYGTTTAYGNSTASADAGQGSAFESLDAPLSDLQPETTYHFRAVATNSAGTSTGPDFSFTTEPASCPNQTLREENDSLALPQCRAYEQVSPVEKKGYSVALETFSADGDHALFSSTGIFAGEPSFGSQYLARRSPDGWITEGIDVPWSLGTVNNAFPQIASADLSQFASANVTLQPSGPFEAALFLRRPDGSWSQASPPLVPTEQKQQILDSFTAIPVAASADLSKILFETNAPLLAADKIPGGGGNGRFYELLGADTSSPSLRLAAVSDGPAGAQLPLCNPSTIQQAAPESPPFVSSDGGTVIFTLWSPALPGGCSEAEDVQPYQVLARIDGQSTVDLSQPQPNDECTTGACQSASLAGAAFKGASADGSKAFFLSTQQLTDAASEDPHGADGIAHGGKNSTKLKNECETDPEGRSGCNLYVYDFSRSTGHNLLALSAGDTSGLGPEVHNVLAASADGSHVYFTAAGVLSSQPDLLGRFAQPGAENLYVADTESGRVSFIADLCTGEEHSRVLTGLAQCPGSGSDIGFIQENGPVGFDVTSDGRFLAFTSYAQLTPDDTNQAADIYRYDAQSASLVRVSTGHEGEDENGNGGGQDAALFAHPELAERNPTLAVDVISDDGSTVAFTTARPLQDSAENGLADGYEWHQGQVTLLSGGHSPNPVRQIRVSASSRDLVFGTAQGLRPTDVDGLRDVYDARVAGGFPLPEGGTPICESSETCHGEGTHAGQEPAFGSGSLQHEPETITCPKHFVRRHGRCIKKHIRHRKKRHHERSHRRAAAHRGGAR